MQDTNRQDHITPQAMDEYFNFELEANSVRSISAIRQTRIEERELIASARMFLPRMGCQKA